MEDGMKGICFKASENKYVEYFIYPKEVSIGYRSIMEIYELDANNVAHSTGSEVIQYDWDMELLCTVELYPKYFFPKYENTQMYYDDKEYYGADCNTDGVIGLAKALNFTIKKGLELANIKPY